MLSWVYVFGYGSLLNARSLCSTLPDVGVGDCVPAHLRGFVRTFDVAFPNDGSQPDKAFVDAGGARPPVVLFANLSRAGSEALVNGVLIPVRPTGLAALRRRELRYEAVDVTRAVRPEAAGGARAQVVAFVGRPQFTQPQAARRGVVPSDYLATIAAGVGRWERQAPGFRADFEASTRLPDPRVVVALRRVEGGG